MNPERIVFTDTPPFIPVPEALQRRKFEVILWSLDKDAAPIESPTSAWADFFNRYSREIDDATSCARDVLYTEQPNFKGVTQ